MHFITLMTSYFDVTSHEFDFRDLYGDRSYKKDSLETQCQMNIDVAIKLNPNVGNSKGVYV